MYLDNVLLGTQASLSARPTNSAPVSFGQANYSTAEEYAGRIQDCTIWNRALTADELSILWNGNAGIKIEDTSGAWVEKGTA